MFRFALLSGVISLMFSQLCLAAASAAMIDPSSCLANIRQQALQADISADIVDKVLASVKIEPKIIDLDRKQPEFSTTFTDYIGKRVNETRINKGRELRQQHAALLQTLSRRYGVPGHYLVAFWGLETNFGSYMGKKHAPSALATLACDKRRPVFFTAELIETMRLVAKHNLDPKNMESSWAGAMGQTQFMPSTYARYAVDGDGDGKVNLWDSIPDALASGANYLQTLDWQTRRRWGREVRIPENFDWSQTGREQPQSLAAWRKAGVRNAYGGELANLSDMDGAIVAPAGHKGPVFLAYDNFKVIMGWNRSEYYALSVGMLADRIAGGNGLRKPLPTGKGLRRSEIKRIQQALNNKGFDSGTPDGVVGSATRIAVRTFQSKNNLVADGYPDKKLLRLLQQ